MSSVWVCPLCSIWFAFQAKSSSAEEKRGPVGQAVFFPEPSSKDDSNERTETTVGIDIASLEVFYATLMSLKNDKLFATLRTANTACMRVLKSFLDNYWKHARYVLFFSSQQRVCNHVKK